MEPQVALEQSGSTSAARVRGSCGASLRSQGCLRWGVRPWRSCSPSGPFPARRSAPTSLGLTPPTLPEAGRLPATLPLHPGGNQGQR